MIHARPLTWLALPLGLALAAAAPATAQEAGGGEAAPAQAPPAEVRAATPAAPAAPAPLGGLVAARDAETGELRAPTAEELAELAAEFGLLRSDEGLVPVVRPDGTVTVNLQGRYLDFALATRGPDGAAVPHCTSEPAQAVSILTGARLGAAAGDHGQPPVQEVRDDR
jgi:hypothetical protein